MIGEADIAKGCENKTITKCFLGSVNMREKNKGCLLVINAIVIRILVKHILFSFYLGRLSLKSA